MNLTGRVRAFHRRFGHPIAHWPRVPNEDTVRFRLRLICEEFRELVESALDTTGDEDTVHVRRRNLEDAWDVIQNAIAGKYLYQRAPVKVDLPAFADALADIAYVVEGTNVAFGIDSESVLCAVHAANMAKEPNGSDKPTKPPGWSPPDVASLLKDHGWTP